MAESRIQELYIPRGAEKSFTVVGFHQCFPSMSAVSSTSRSLSAASRISLFESQVMTQEWSIMVYNMGFASGCLIRVSHQGISSGFPIRISHQGFPSGSMISSTSQSLLVASRISNGDREAVPPGFPFKISLTSAVSSTSRLLSAGSK